MDPKDYPPLPPPEIVNVSKENLSGLPEEICAFADKVLGKGWSQLLNKDCYDAEDYQLALQQVLLLNVAVHVNEQLTEDDLNTLSSEEDKQKRLDIHQKRSGIAKRLALLFQGKCDVFSAQNPSIVNLSLLKRPSKKGKRCVSEIQDSEGFTQPRNTARPAKLVKANAEINVSNKFDKLGENANADNTATNNDMEVSA